MVRRCHRTTPGLAGLAALAGLTLACGKRGDPLPPLPRTPQAVSGLKLSQRGDRLLVTYVTPRTTTGGQRLPVLDIDLLRADVEGDFVKVARKTTGKAAPGELLVESQPLPPPGTHVRVAARARVGGEASALSSVLTLTSQPPPVAPTGLAAQLEPEGVALSWSGPVLPPPAAAPPAVASPSPPPTAPARSPASPAPSSPVAPSPAAPPSAPGFWVYRREKAGTYARPLNPAPSPASLYQDTSSTPGQNVCYVVRTVLATDPVVESADSNETCLTARDIKPPAAPSGVTALRRDGAVEVSWSPSSEPDLAAYRVYRSAGGNPPERLAEVSTAERQYRDPAPPAGTAPVYTVTAVDAAGNESPPSRPSEATTP